MSSFNLSEQTSAQQVERSSFISKVYGWMALALGVTAVTAMVVASSQTLTAIFLGNRIVFYILLFAELGLVMGVTAAINRISAMTATLLFALYAMVNGLTLSAIFLIYTHTSIGTTFLITGGTFGIMSLYGYTTKRDLTSMGNLLVMVLIGMIIASLVNFFLKSTALHWIITYVGVIVFVGLTAWDTQKIKQIGEAGFADADSRQKVAILGALTLYLDFINLFLLLLEIFGKRRD